MTHANLLSNHQIRTILLYDFKCGRSAAESSRNISAAFGEGCVSERTARDWFAKFKNGDFGLDDQPRSGRPPAVDNDQLRQLVEADPRQTTRELAAHLEVSQTAIVDHLRAIGKVSKLNTWVPHALMEFDRQRRAEAAAALLSFRRTNAWLDTIVTGDEKWCLYVNVTRKRSWCDAGVAAQTQPKPELHQRKVMLSVWWDVRGVIHWELLPTNTTITAEVYCAQLDRLATAIQQHRPVQTVVRFLHDNARPHVAKLTRQKLIDLGWEVLPHPPYSPDLAPSDYHLFLALSNSLRDLSFENEDALQEKLAQFFASKHAEWYKSGICALPKKWQQVIDCDGDYIA